MIDKINKDGQPTANEVNKANLPQVDGLNIVSATVTPTNVGGRVDLIVTGAPARIRRFRAALEATMVINPPTLGRDPVVAFTFDSRSDSSLLTQTTQILIDALEMTKMTPAHEAATEETVSTTTAAATTARGRRTTDRAPRTRMTVYSRRR